MWNFVKFDKESKASTIGGMSMKEIGIVICNFNKKDYILNCIQSVLDADGDNYDIYVVDNASTDGSAEAIKEKYGQQVILLENEENLGGAGGFDTGLEAVMQREYKYYMLMDNDIIVDKEAIVSLHDFMESSEHQDVGMVGSKVYFMDDPERIWGYGGRIDFNEYVQKDNYKNMKDSAEIPEISYCDYVAACSLMVRAEAVKKVGIMPRDNFIYWDDMEWGWRFNQAGYKVCVYGKSKIWHKAGGRNAGNTFIHYYMWRNRINFFMKFLPDEQKERFADCILSEMFRMIYSVNLKGETNIVKTLMYAFDDAVHGVRGKAAEGKILDRPEVPNRVEEALKNKKDVIIRYNGNMEGLGNIVKNISKFAPDIKMAISTIDCPEEFERLQTQYPQCEIVRDYVPEKYDSHLVMCEHIFKLTPDLPRDSYIDPWCNIIYTQEDFIYASSFEQTRKLFVLCKKDIILQKQ